MNRTKTLTLEDENIKKEPYQYAHSVLRIILAEFGGILEAKNSGQISYCIIFCNKNTLLLNSWKC